MKLPIFALFGLLAVIAGPASPAQTPANVGMVERAFKPGGTIAMDLSAGGYTIRGTAEDTIRVRWQTRDAASAAQSKAEVAVAGTSATIRTRGSKNDFKVQIELPHRSDLNVSLSAGDLQVLRIEGNKELSMWAGDVTMEVGGPELYKQVDASVRFGELTLSPFNANKGGILRSFHWNGSGKYTISAKLFAGDLKLVR
jgi:hypothetical protein